AGQLNGQAMDQAGVVGEIAQVRLVVRRAHRHAVELRLDVPDVAIERVRVRAVPVVDQRAGVVGGRPAWSRSRGGRGHGGDDVADPLAGAAVHAGDELRDREGQ